MQWYVKMIVDEASLLFMAAMVLPSFSFGHALELVPGTWLLTALKRPQHRPCP